MIDQGFVGGEPIPGAPVVGMPGLDSPSSLGSHTSPGSQVTPEMLRAYRRKWYANNQEHAKAKVVERRQDLQRFVDDLKASRTCLRCGEKHPACLEFYPPELLAHEQAAYEQVGHEQVAGNNIGRRGNGTSGDMSHGVGNGVSSVKSNSNGNGISNAVLRKGWSKERIVEH